MTTPFSPLRYAAVLACVVLVSGCHASDGPRSEQDAELAPEVEAGTEGESEPIDSGGGPLGALDAGALDAGALDAGAPDAGAPDADVGLPDATPPGPDATLCEDLDGDGYGVGCAKGEDCDDSNANLNPGAAEIDWDAVDQNCNGKLGKRFQQSAVSLADPLGGQLMFDDGILVVLNKQVGIYALEDLEQPLYTGPLLEGFPQGAVFRDGTLIARAADALEITLYDLTNPAAGPFETARVAIERAAVFDLSQDGKTLFVLDQGSEVVQQLKVYDLTDRSSPELVQSFAPGCTRSGYVQVAGTNLALSCPGQFWDRFALFDTTDPTNLKLIAERSYDATNSRFLTVAQGYAYFAEQSAHRRYPILESSFGPAETLDMPSVDGEHWSWTNSRSAQGLFFLRKQDWDLDESLCLVSAASLTPRCFDGLMDQGELYASQQVLVDGAQILVSSWQHARHVDLTDLDAPVLGAQWHQVAARSQPALIGEDLIVSTFGGMAAFAADTLKFKSYAPTEHDRHYCGTAAGAVAYGVGLQGGLSVVSFEEPTRPATWQRLRTLARPFRCRVVARGAEQFLLLGDERSLRVLKLDSTGRVQEEVRSYGFERLGAIEDDGTRLFVATEVQGERTISVVPLYHQDAPTAFSLSVKDGVYGMVVHQGKLVYFDQNALHVVDLTDSSETSLAQVGLYKLFVVADSVFVLANTAPFLRVLTAQGLVGVEAGQPPAYGWSTGVAAQGNRLILLESVSVNADNLYSFELVDEH